MNRFTKAVVTGCMLGLCFARSEAAPFGRSMFAGEPEVLREDAARTVFEQCSRPAPNPSQILPAPSKVELREVDKAVERHIAFEHAARRPVPASTMSYSRQYVAYELAGRRMIYGNFFPAAYHEGGEHPAGRAVVACDGGSQFWGITFDPKTGRVESLSFNGEG